MGELSFHMYPTILSDKWSEGFGEDDNILLSNRNVTY